MITRKRKNFGRKVRKDLTSHEKSSLKKYKTRFSKWHNKQIDLLTFCINLNFTISIAIAGFIISNQDKPIFKDQIILDKYSLIKTTLFLLSLVATIGVIAIISRLNDFRLTKNIVKTRRRIFELKEDIKYEDTKQSNQECLKSHRDDLIYWAAFLGKLTWALVYLQLIILLTTIWAIVLST